MPRFPQGKFVTLTVAHVCHNNPLALGIKKDIVCMTNDEFYVIGA